MKLKLTLIIVSICLCSAGCANVENYVSEEGIKKINNVDIFYKIIGIGDPIIVLHGGPLLPHDYLLPHLEQLSQNYTLLFFDQRLTGRSSSDLDSTAINIDNFIEDIEYLRIEFGFDKINLFAHSWGGFLAMKYALKYAQNLNTLMLINSAPPSKEFDIESQEKQRENMTEMDMEERTKLMQSDAFQSREIAAYEKLFKIVFRSQFYNRSYIDSLNFNLPEHFIQNSAKLIYLGKDAIDYDLHEKLKELTVPVLLVTGDNDPIADQAFKKMVNVFSDREEYTMENTGHFPFVESKMEFFGIVEKFLRNHPIN